MSREEAFRQGSPSLEGGGRGVGPALSVRGLTKRFGDLLAADGLDLDFYRGEVHAVLGENGAGKSTLMKMLYGYERPNGGEILLDGRPVRFEAPGDARRHGIAMVFQNFTLVPALTVLENIALMDPSRSLRLDRACRRASARSRGPTASPWSQCLRGRPLRRRAAASDPEAARRRRLDPDLRKPTSVLAPHEVDALLAVLARLRADGYTVILISHKMREVFAVAVG
jgi:simple sugar transport system ATP-binding protein